MVEIWKDIEGYEGLYQVSNLGRVKSLDRKIISNDKKNIKKGLVKEYIKKGKILKFGVQTNKYLVVTLWKNGIQKTKLVHRLVIQAFKSNPNNYPVINHKDENPQNNCIDNLEWCSQSYNINYGRRNKKVAQKLGRKVIQLDKDFLIVNVYESLHEAGEKTGLDYRNIYSCCIGRCKNVGGFKWKYGDR